MRFQSLGTLDGKPFDLIITNTTPVYYGRETCLAGCNDENNGLLFELPVQVNRSYSLLLRFVDPKNGDTDVMLPAFQMSVFDIDSAKKNGITSFERTTFRTDGTGSFTYTAGALVDASGASSSTGITFQNKGAYSGPVKNPKNYGILDLTPEQLEVSVTTVVADIRVQRKCQP